jgi:NAD(P)-dependent dehydrogenase (short-subunit alcohol dehydrogenase family)
MTNASAVPGSSLAGRNVFVVGASAGLGRAFAIAAVGEGASVVMAARRGDALKEAIAEAGGGSAVVGDLCIPDDCRRMAEEARAELGSIDLVLVAAGMARLRRMEQVTPEDWAAVLGTNLIGINQTIAALLPALAPNAIVAVVSSESVGDPYHSLATYAASKAALEETMRGWRIEQSGVRFSVLAIGQTFPTEFAFSFDPGELGQVIPVWAAQGKARAELMKVEELADAMIGVLGAVLPHASVGLETAMFRTPAPYVDGLGAMSIEGL